MKPHIHYAEIIAWAGGAQIEMKTKTGHWLQTYPLWDEEIEYRIKPEVKQPVVRWKWAWKDKLPALGEVWMDTEAFYTEEEIRLDDENDYIKLDYTRTEFPE